MWYRSVIIQLAVRLLLHYYDELHLASEGGESVTSAARMRRKQSCACDRSAGTFAFAGGRNVSPIAKTVIPTFTVTFLCERKHKLVCGNPALVWHRAQLGQWAAPRAVPERAVAQPLERALT
ncbi:unnamed protein product [Danaus chrysippus]|uniref:(African queen) hypothetical protein n=1 Tax=Danaus chrysippus TaxID=151541 RepID=A0A8J2Q0I3_9NEOP|nr:unnamed protein product [Danaus chrysippus]